MPEEYITIGECIAIMRSGKTFSLTCVRYDRHRKTGGDLLEIAEAELLNPKKEAEETSQRHQRPLTPGEMMQINQDAGLQDTRNPNHRHNHTRNIRILCDGHPTDPPVKVHPPLFLTFNNKTVVP